MQYGDHVTHMGQMLSKCIVSEPIFKDIRKSIARLLVCWSNLDKRTLTKERRATIQARTGHPKAPQFQLVSLVGLSGAQCSFIIHKSQIRGCPYPKFGNSNLLPSCMERCRLSITKEINIVSNAIYSSLHENRPPLSLQLCFLIVLVAEFCTLKCKLKLTSLMKMEESKS